MASSVLILGASGRFGRHAKAAFTSAGWRVSTFDRRRDVLDIAAQGCDVIVNAWNPGYGDWADQVPKLHAEVRRVAKSTGATVILPGNVYVFGKQTASPWSERSRHGATNPLGRIRIEMEAAYKEEGVRTIVLRAGDFLDTKASGNWFDKVMVPGLAKGKFVYPGDPRALHAWGYLPDVARAAVDLAELRADLPEFCDVPFEGFTLSGQDMACMLERVTGHPVKRRRMAWWPLRLLSPLSGMLRGVCEMRYLWSTPHQLDGTRMSELLPDFCPTPVEVALSRCVAHVAPSATARRVMARA